MLKYIISFICCLALVSCQKDVAVTDQNKVRVILTLSMPEATTGSRATDTEITDEGTQQECAIDKDRLHIVFYDNQGKYVATVEHLSLLQENTTTYKVVGSVALAAEQFTNNRFSGKVMVYANVDGVNDQSDYTSDDVSLLRYDYSPTEAYIPMWGVKKLEHIQLAPGTQVDINVINLLRAEAKVYVFLRQDMIESGYSLSHVSLSRYNTKGYCLPLLENYRDLDDADNLVHDKYAHFFPSQAQGELDMTNKVVYVPEYQNQGEGTQAAVVRLTLRDEKGQETDYELPFVNYVDGTPGTNMMDILRNHYYKFEVYKGSNGKLQVNLVVRKWWKETHSEILM